MKVSKKSAFVLISVCVIGLVFFIRYKFFPGEADLRVAQEKALIEGIKKEPDEYQRFSHIRDHIQDIIVAYGIEGSISFIKEMVKTEKLDLVHCHPLLHMVGHEAYRIYGNNFSRIAAMATPMCQDAFLHGVEAQIAWTSGPDQGINFRKFCKSIQSIRPGFVCYHGAGHAFIEMELNPFNLVGALERCDAIKNFDGGRSDICWRGVFSEYGSLLIGIDGDTLLPIPGERRVTNPFLPPLLFCQKLANKYLDSCVSQLTKTVINITDVAKSFRSCTKEEYSKLTQEICIQYLSFFYYTNVLFSEKVPHLPNDFSLLPQRLYSAFFRGVADAFNHAKTSGLIRNMQEFCMAIVNQSYRRSCIEFD